MLNNRISEGVTYLSEPGQQIFAYDIYIEVRKTEGRLYPDEVLKNLPDIPTGYKLKKEWKVRKASAEKLVKYFAKYNNNELLEVGCGNGWLSNFLAVRTGNIITALDLNETELKQAAKVFAKTVNLRFIFGDIFENIFPAKTFDFILLAGSVQYFPDFDNLITQLLFYLKPGGEIHILDSHFYTREEKESAEKRSKNYYHSIGFPEMIKNYYHRSWDELEGQNYIIVNLKETRCFRLLNKIKIAARNIFPWIIIKNSRHSVAI